jgi:hypothetical protein
MESEIFVSEDDKNSMITSSKNNTALNDRTMSEVVELLFENLKEESDNIDMISRKTILELAEKNLNLVMKVQMDSLKNIMPNTNINDALEHIQKYLSLLQEILEKFGSQLDKNTYKIVSSFALELIQNMITNTYRDTDRTKSYEKKAIPLTKILVYLSKTYFHEVLADLMILFVPGSVPHRLVIELLTELAVVYPIQATQNYHDVISRTLPILASVSDENLRVVFSKFFSQVTESIIITLESTQDTKDTKNINMDSLSHLFATAFDLIFAQWLICKSNTNKLYIVNSLVMMGTLLPENSMRNNLESVVTLFTQNIKKDSLQENIMLCKTFRIFFENVVVRYKERLEITITPLLIAIFPLLTCVNISPNVKDFDPLFMQVKSEILKIFFLFFKNYLDKTFNFLISRFEVVPLLERLANMYLIKTMLLRCDNLNTTYRDMLLSSISKATHESDFELKFALLELIYILYEKNLLTKESSIKILSHLVKEASYSDEEAVEKDSKNYPFYTNIKIVRDKAENVLIDAINKIPESEKYFWPHILDYLYDQKYDGGSYIICRIIIAIKTLYDNKLEELKIDFSQSSLPTPAQILVKLFIILCNPSKRTGLAQLALQATKTLLPLLNPDFTKYNLDTDEIEIYLRRGRLFDFDIYNDILLSMFEKILNEVKNAEFLTYLTDTIIENLSKYKDDELVVGFLIRLEGVVLSKINKREVIKNQLDNLFNIAHPEFKNDVINGNQNQSNPSNSLRIGVGEAFGFAAKSHLDLTLDKINAIFKAEIKFKKPTGFSAIFQSSKDPEISPSITTTLITALGSIAKYADSALLASRINSNFISHIDKYFKDEKNPKALRYACLIALGHIFKALQKLSSFYIDKGEIFMLENRDQYLEAMVRIFKIEKSVNETKIAALNNTAHLIKLDPPVSLEQCKNYIFLAFSIFDLKEIKENTLSDDLRERILESVNNVFESILVHENHFVTTLDKISVQLEGFTVVTIENILNYDKDLLTCWDFFSMTLEKFIERYLRESNDEYLKDIIIERTQIYVNSKKSVKFNSEEFPNWVASLICLLILLFDDSNNDKEGTFLCISRLLTGLDVFDFTYAGDNNHMADELALIIKNKFSKEDFLFLYKKLFYLVKNIHLNPSVNKHASYLLEKLLLTSTEYFSEEEKNNKVTEEIFDELIRSLECIAKEDASITSDRYLNTLKMGEEFAKTNIGLVLDTCLKEEYGLPLPVSLMSIIQRICKEKALVTKIFTRITDIINNGEPGFENKPNYSVCASTIVLGTMLQTHDTIITPLIKKFFPQLLSTLLLRIGSAHSINYTSDAFKSNEEDPRNQTVWALQQLMSYSDEVELNTCLESGGSIQSKIINTYEFDEGIYELMLIYCKKTEHAKQSLMFDFLQGFLERPWGGQRVVVVSCYAQFLNFASVIHCKTDPQTVTEWRNKLIIELTKTISDSDELARKQSIRGLANLCKVYSDCTVDIENYIRIIEKITDEGKYKHKFR